MCINQYKYMEFKFISNLKTSCSYEVIPYHALQVYTQKDQ